MMITIRRRVAFLLATVFLVASEGLSSPSPTAKRILFDVPVSNNGARCRIIAYKASPLKAILIIVVLVCAGDDSLTISSSSTDYWRLMQKGIPESELAVMSPADLGGFKSDEFLRINPQGKVPALKCQETGMAIAESDTVGRFLLSEYAHLGPSFQPDNPISNTMARFHDIYLTSIQMCLYKPGPPFGSFGTRKDALKEFSKQLYVLAGMMDPTGPYLCGGEVSLADATIFPSVLFAVHMFPKFDHGIEQPVPEKIESWFETMKNTDPAFQKVYEEVRSTMATIFNVS